MKAQAVIATFRSFLDGKPEDAVTFIRQIEAAEQAAGRTSISGQLRRMMDSRAGRGQMIKLEDAPASIRSADCTRTLESLFLPASVRSAVQQILREWNGRDLLAGHGLRPRNVVMLHGPSGNGKTALAGAIANELKVPFGIVCYGEMVASHLGETSKNLSTAFRWINGNPCVVLIDEADSLLSKRTFGTDAAGRERDNTVNSLMLELDALSPRSMVIFATNARAHLDTALTRRLCVDLELTPPQNGERLAMIEAMTKRWPFIADKKWRELAQQAPSFAAIESLAQDEARETLLSSGAAISVGNRHLAIVGHAD